MWFQCARPITIFFQLLAEHRTERFCKRKELVCDRILRNQDLVAQPLQTARQLGELTPPTKWCKIFFEDEFEFPSLMNQYSNVLF